MKNYGYTTISVKHNTKQKLSEIAKKKRTNMRLCMEDMIEEEHQKILNKNITSDI